MEGGRETGREDRGMRTGRLSTWKPSLSFQVESMHLWLTVTLSVLKARSPKVIYFCVPFYLVKMNDKVLISYLLLQSLFSS